MNQTYVKNSPYFEPNEKIVEPLDQSDISDLDLLTRT